MVAAEKSLELSDWLVFLAASKGFCELRMWC